MNRSVLLPLIFLLASAQAVLTQPADIDDEPRPGFGGFVDLNINFHSAEFAKLPGIPSCCPRYESGSGVGPTLGVFYEYPFSRNLLLDLRVGYFSSGAVLSTVEETTVILGNEPGTAKFEHSVDADLSSVAIEPLFGYRLGSSLTLQLGGHVGYVLTKNFSQKETMLEPEDIGTFENGRRIRNDTGGVIPDASSIEAAIVAGGKLTFPLNGKRTLFLEPELLFSLGLTDVAESIAWKRNALRIGVGVRFSPERDRTPVIADVPVTPAPPKEPVVPVVPPSSAISATVEAVGVEDDGTEVPRVTLRAEEFVSTSLRPLLNYIFFEDGSSDLPSRYTRLASTQTSGFRVDNLYNVETLPTYYHILNIVGRRMMEHPTAKITLTGCNSDVGREKGDLDLSNSRAEAVREYLTGVWSIPPDRIRIASRGLPAKPSNANEQDGIAENRRVEIESDTWQILEPVVTSDTLRTVSPPVIRFRPVVTAASEVSGWRLEAKQPSGLSKEFTGGKSVPELIDWDINAEGNRLSTAAGSNRIDYTLNAAAVSGEETTTQTQRIPIELITIQKKRTERIADKEIDRYSLILFDFDRADLNSANRRIGDFIKGRMSPQATATITGYTDRIGDSEYNRGLSDERAKSTARALGLSAADARGVGESTLLYDNSLPEGRFYCRTVSVVVETPVSNR